MFSSDASSFSEPSGIIEPVSFSYPFLLARTILDDLTKQNASPATFAKIDADYRHLWVDIADWDNDLKHNLASFYAEIAENCPASFRLLKEKMPHLEGALRLCAAEYSCFIFPARAAEFVKSYPDDALFFAKIILQNPPPKTPPFHHTKAVGNLRRYHPALYKTAFEAVKNDKPDLANIVATNKLSDREHEV